MAHSIVGMEARDLRGRDGSRGISLPLREAYLSGFRYVPGPHFHGVSFSIQSFSNKPKTATSTRKQ